MLDGARILRAGPVTAHFIDGDLRHIRVDGRQVLNRVYFAVRDPKWGTLVNSLANLRIQEANGGFFVAYDAVCRAGEIHFRFKAEIAGAADGTIAWRAHGEALASFMKNRVGWCVLHPVEGLAGERCEVEHSDGSAERGWFPRYISPHQPFFDVRAIRHEVRPGLTAEVRFSGDTFEMEDQRNYADSTYKIYSTPLALPFPARMKAGDRVHQIVTLKLDRVVRVDLDGEPRPMPEVGFVWSPALTADAVAALRPTHVRVDRPEDLDAAAALHVRLECPFVTDYPQRRVLVLDGAPVPGEVPPGAEIAVGTSVFFAELNRRHPDTGRADAVCFPIDPRVHANDDLSIVENLPSQAAIVEGACRIFPGKGVAATPVGLNPERQRSWFGAAWALGSLKHLAESGATSVTFDYPYEILGAVAGATHVLPCRSSDPLAVEALAVRQEGRVRVFLANFTPADRRVEVQGQIVTVPACRLTAGEL
jgi:hypothetical protein